MEIVVEANVTERTPHLPVIKIPFEFPFRDAVVSTQVAVMTSMKCWEQKCGHCFSVGAGGICLTCIGR